jgi:hypothetical protein
VLSQPKIEAIFRNFVTVRLHTDRVPAGVTQVPDAQGATEFRNEKFKNYALPYYVIVKPKGKTLEKMTLEKIAYYEQGLITDVDEFAAFLEKALALSKQG